MHCCASFARSSASPSHKDLAPLTFASHAYPDFHLLMPVYLCRRWDGEVTAHEGQEFLWVKPDRLHLYDMPPADAPLRSCWAIPLKSTPVSPRLECRAGEAEKPSYPRPAPLWWRAHRQDATALPGLSGFCWLDQVPSR